MLIIKLIILLLCNVIIRSNISFLIHDQNGLYYCATNSSSGLTWIDKDEKSTFIPQTKNEKIHAISPSKLMWFMIFDRRWERLKKYETWPSHEPLDVNYTPSNEKKIEITFSVRTEIEADIFLCNHEDGDYKCYWFLLKSDSKVVINKCNSGKITDIRKYCDYDHKKEDNSVIHLNNETWIHFQILKKDNNVILNQVMGSTHKQKINFQDFASFKITKLFVSTKYGRGLWKFHAIKSQIYTETTNKTVAKMKKLTWPLCVNFFVAMCENCKITVRITKSSDLSYVILSKSFNFSGSRSWNEITFIPEDIPKREQMTMFITTGKIKNVSGSNFWAIDDIRSCSSNEFRMISSRNKSKCQIINTDYTKLVLEENMVSSSDNLNCCDITNGKICGPSDIHQNTKNVYYNTTFPNDFYKKLNNDRSEWINISQTFFVDRETFNTLCIPKQLTIWTTTTTSPVNNNNTTTSIPLDTGRD